MPDEAARPPRSGEFRERQPGSGHQTSPHLLFHSAGQSRPASAALKLPCAEELLLGATCRLVIAPDSVGAGFFKRSSFGSSLLAVWGSKLTALQQLDKRTQHFDVDLQGGWLSNRPYWSGRAVVKSRYAWLGVTRADNYVPQHIQFSSVQAGSAWKFLTAYASVFTSKCSTNESVGVRAAFGRLTLGAQSYRGVSTFTDVMADYRYSRWHVGVDYMRNRAAVSAGYTSNRFGVDVGHQVVYDALLRRFTQVMALTVTFRVRDALSSTSRLKTRGWRYTAYGNDYLYGAGAGPGRYSNARGLRGHPFGGKVVDEQGKPIDGAAVRLGKETVYTDRNGEFSARSKAGVLSVSVEPEEFVQQGEWHVVSAPASAAPDEPLRIVVKKVFREQ